MAIYTTDIIYTKKLKNILRGATNKDEIDGQIREIVEDTLKRHKGGDIIVPIFAEEFINESEREEYHILDILIKTDVIQSKPPKE